MVDVYSTLSNPNALGTLGADQQQQALQAMAATQQQNNAILKTYDPDTVLGGQMLALKMHPDYPDLQFGTNAHSVGEGIVQGLGNAVHNHLAIKQYSQRNKQIGDFANSYDLAQKNYRDMADKQATDTAKEHQANIELGTQAMAILNDPAATPEQKQQAMGHLNTALAGGVAKTYGTHYATQSATNALAPETGDAAAKQHQHEIYNNMQWANKNLPRIEMSGIPQPAGVNAATHFWGGKPITSMDVQEQTANVIGKGLANQSAANDLSVQPTLNQQKVDQGALDIERAGYDNQVKAVEAKFAETEKRLSVTKNTQEAKAYAIAHQLFDQLKQSGDLYSADPNKQAEIQARLAMGSIKWDPPNYSYTSIKKKNGEIWMLDKNSGQVGKLGPDGKVSQWQDLQQ